MMNLIQEFINNYFLSNSKELPQLILTENEKNDLTEMRPGCRDRGQIVGSFSENKNSY